MTQSKCKIKVAKNGPYYVSGDVPLSEKIITPQGHSYVYKLGRVYEHRATYALCRCGHTSTPPFCDGSHVKAHFDGAETAARTKFQDRAKKYEGPELDMLDDERCAFARFCHQEEGSAWELVRASDKPGFKAAAVKAACECPAGRLEVYDKQGKLMEPELAPEIEILQDPERGVSGPIYVKGKIPLEAADGYEYEIRNRMALCRCGASENKPFCDACHVGVSYHDEPKPKAEKG